MRFIRLLQHDCFWQVPANPFVKGEGAVAAALWPPPPPAPMLLCFLSEAAVAAGAAVLLGEEAALPPFRATRKLWWHFQGRSAAVSCPQDTQAAASGCWTTRRGGADGLCRDVLFIPSPPSFKGIRAEFGTTLEYFIYWRMVRLFCVLMKLDKKDSKGRLAQLHYTIR
jgi:hypothetical protein